jgi:dipeptidyl-peptidase-4
VNKGKDLLWLSERSGWRHAYLAGVDARGFVPVTQGQFDVIAVEAVDAAGGWLYYAASPENATQRYLYRTRLDGGTPERLTPDDQRGWHTYDFSPDCRWAMHTYSTFTNPPVVELIRLPEKKSVRVLADNRKLRERLATLKMPTAEFLKVDIGEGITLDARCFKPPGLDPSAKYPLLMFVYGEPHGQIVKDMWGGAQGLWHAMLAQHGYIVASVDNRGTAAPRGREWRRSVHRQIGFAGTGGGSESLAATLAVGGCVARRSMGLERRWKHESECDFPLSGPLHHRHGRGSQRQSTAL